MIPTRRAGFGFGSDLRLFRWRGIDFTANWSWALLVALLVYVAAELFTGLLGPSARGAAWALAFVAAGLAVASLYAHELAHALVARAYGVEVRTISLFLLGGVAHISQESPSPRAEFLIAAAGPAMSLALGVFGGLVSAALGTAAPPLGALGLWMALLNLPLALFNLVPAYPLDGGRVLRSVLWFAGQDLRWASAIAARFGQAGAVLLLFAGLYGAFTGTATLVSGLWLVLIAWFLYSGAVSAHRATVFRDALGRVTVASVMQRHFGHVEAGASLRSFAEEHIRVDEQARRGPRAYGVYRGDLLIGLVGLMDLRRVPASTWSSVAVERVMLPLEAAPRLLPDQSAAQALQLLLGEGYEQLPVVAEDRLLGVVSRADLARAAAQHQG